MLQVKYSTYFDLDLASMSGDEIHKLQTAVVEELKRRHNAKDILIKDVPEFYHWDKKLDCLKRIIWRSNNPSAPYDTTFAPMISDLSKVDAKHFDSAIGIGAKALDTINEVLIDYGYKPII